MNLQEFVKDVLVSLDKAVDEARTEMKRDVHFSDTAQQLQMRGAGGLPIGGKKAGFGQAS